MYWKDLLRRGCSPHGVLSPRGRFKQRTPKHPQLIYPSPILLSPSWAESNAGVGDGFRFPRVNGERVDV